MIVKQTSVMRTRMKFVAAVLAIVASATTGSVVLAQDQTAKPSTPPAADKMELGGDGGGMMGMGSDSKGMMGKMSGMKQMKCCGQGMSHDDHSASEKHDEKKIADRFLLKR